MARLDNDSSKNKKVPGVNIAGDYSVRGVDIAPDGVTEEAYGSEVGDLESLETIEPQSQGRMSPADARHMQEQREQTRRESLKATSNTQSSFGTEAGKRIVNPSSDPNANTDWPVDE